MRAAVNGDTRVVFVCNPNNPTSTYVTAREVHEFVASIPDDVFVVMDEAYVDYVDAPDYPDSLQDAPRRTPTWSCCAPSRSSSPSPACAWATRWRTRRGRRASPGAAAVQREPARAGGGNGCARLRGRACSRSRRRPSPSASACATPVLKLGLVCPPSQANFVFVDLGTSDGRSLRRAACGAAGRAAPRAVRIHAQQLPHHHRYTGRERPADRALCATSSSAHPTRRAGSAYEFIPRTHSEELLRTFSHSPSTDRRAPERRTTARLVARRLGLRHIDTGAMYRAVTLCRARAGIDPGDGERLAFAGERVSRSASCRRRDDEPRVRVGGARRDRP